jgi:hypothetical protein
MRGDKTLFGYFDAHNGKRAAVTGMLRYEISARWQKMPEPYSKSLGSFCPGERDGSVRRGFSPRQKHWANCEVRLLSSAIFPRRVGQVCRPPEGPPGPSLDMPYPQRGWSPVANQFRMLLSERLSCAA